MEIISCFARPKPRPHVHRCRDLMERATRDLGIRQSNGDPIVKRGYFRRFNARDPFLTLYNSADAPHHSSANTYIVFPRLIIQTNLFRRSALSVYISLSFSRLKRLPVFFSQACTSLIFSSTRPMVCICSKSCKTFFAAAVERDRYRKLSRFLHGGVFEAAKQYPWK